MAASGGVRSKSSDPTIEWTPLSLTHVEYPKGDWLGKIFALASLSPFGILSGFVALILFRRDLHTIFFFIGTLFNEIVNLTLKHIICEERPLHRHVQYVEYGMPSAHAQFCWFFATYVVCFVFLRLHHLNNNSPLESFWKIVIIVSCLSLAIVVNISRVYLQYHTWKQVLVGTLVGIIVAICWFIVVHCICTPYFPLIASWRGSELLLIRDTSLIPNVLFFEYTKSREETRARSRKFVSIKSQ